MLKVISGGQTGADRTALEVARSLRLDTGGTAPHGWMTEDGPDPSLADFGLVQSAGSFNGYRARTRKNVLDADATVLFGHTTSAGCRATIRFCQELQKPYLENPDANALTAWLTNRWVKVLNVAGNRRSHNPAVVTQVQAVLTPALAHYAEILARPSPVESTPEEETEETETAIHRVGRGTSPLWWAFAAECLHTVARRDADLITEAIWIEGKSRGGFPPTPENRSMGNLIRAARSEGWVEITERWRHAQVGRHKSRETVWRSLIWEGLPGAENPDPVLPMPERDGDEDDDAE